MKYNQQYFDQIHDRKNTLSIKYDVVSDDMLSMWVADMDFKTCDAISEALSKCALHGIYGYSNGGKQYLNSVIKWMKERHHYDIQSEWIIQTPGIVFALIQAIKALTNKNDGVMVMMPIYPPFVKNIVMLERKLVSTQLQLVNDQYVVNFEDMEQKMKDEQVKMLLFCSPHNPIGKMYSKEELEKIAALCLKYNVILVSDEIHMDFELFNHQHIMSASISKEIEQQCITCTSPSKTFNLAGLQVSNIIIANEEYRNKFKQQLDIVGYHGLNVMALHACIAAYNHGSDWLDGMLEYIEENVKLLKQTFNQDHPYIHIYDMQATYLAWLDCRKLNKTDEQLKQFFEEEVKIKCNMGYTFYEGGSGFVRLNLACPKEIVKEAIRRINQKLGV